jgi:short-subunit dehydrogenase involved in D-alanine esterification of teichoic acids
MVAVCGRTAQRLLESREKHPEPLTRVCDVDFTRGIDDFPAGENEIRVNLESPIILCGLIVPLLAKNKGAAGGTSGRT